MTTSPETFKISETVSFSDCFISLSGFLPGNTGDEIRIASIPINPGICFSVERSGGIYSFMAGCENLIHELCLVVSSVICRVRKAVTGKIRMYRERAVKAVYGNAPRFMRL